MLRPSKCLSKIMLTVSSRGGTRGGAADFSWEAVRQDKHRENYLGNSVAAPRGRWALGRDILWYNKHSQNEDSNESTKKKEVSDVKRAEQETMEQMLYVLRLHLEMHSHAYP